MSTAPDPADLVLPVRTYADGTGRAHHHAALPVVLLHAFPFDARMWDEVAAALPADRPVLALDLPGHGAAAGLTPAEPSLEAVADAVAASLSEVGVARAVVAGLSMGGYVALALVERHPGLVAGLGLLDTRATADPDEARANRLRVAAAVEASSTVDEVRPMARAVLGATTLAGRPDVVDRVATWVGEQPPAGVAWSQRAMAARPERGAALAAFAGPVLVLVGDEDTVTPLADAERLRAAAPHAELVVVPGAGHLSAVEQPALVAEALERLARRADAAAER
ncbi:alpha/beta fold hydrolase [Cellulomonas cellasea]|uniref:Alpha/beta hydrolase n=2 Tax=Cellulomonas cellasea TaxID=43670 RepID=A0A4Y3KZB9_9CELL|nr:alpha/beta fold hydrolase [Cellulomonas cellasea]GEA89482.1 alpha/beta hydrolase [Cellulomonas cellasea]